MSELRRKLIELELEHNKRKLQRLNEMIAIADGILIGSGLVVAGLLLIALWVVFFASPV